jgi:hypothetical protein
MLGGHRTPGRHNSDSSVSPQVTGHFAILRATMGAVGKTYPRSHHRARAAQLALIHWGETPCVRCGHPLCEGERVAFEHDDTRARYLGFSHLSPCRECGHKCSSRHGGQLGIARLRARQAQPARSGRTW